MTLDWLPPGRITSLGGKAKTHDVEVPEPDGDVKWVLFVTPPPSWSSQQDRFKWYVSLYHATGDLEGFPVLDENERVKEASGVAPTLAKAKEQAESAFSELRAARSVR